MSLFASREVRRYTTGVSLRGDFKNAPDAEATWCDSLEYIKKNHLEHNFSPCLVWKLVIWQEINSRAPNSLCPNAQMFAQSEESKNESGTQLYLMPVRLELCFSFSVNLSSEISLKLIKTFRVIIIYSCFLFLDSSCGAALCPTLHVVAQ